MSKGKLLISSGKQHLIDYIKFDITFDIRYFSRVVIKTNRPFLFPTITAYHGRGGRE